jgi:hypothetical protein
MVLHEKIEKEITDHECNLLKRFQIKQNHINNDTLMYMIPNHDYWLGDI